jgi:hypothetical protein
MIAQFEVIADGAKVELDTEALTWKIEGADSSSILSGQLNVQARDLFGLAPRTQESAGPGAGLCTVLLTCLPVGQTLFIYLKANVPVAKFTMPQPIKEIKYQIIGERP